MKNNYKRKRIIFISSILLISISALVFVIFNFRNNIVFFYSPSEINSSLLDKRSIRVGGLVKKGSIKKLNNFATEFVITDYQNNLEIFYSGILPDLFRDNQGVVAKGYLMSVNKFYANELLIKHDENYMPPEVAKIIKDNRN
jgi:cytochrome c-type biogenesis protein CcmE